MKQNNAIEVKDIIKYFKVYSDKGHSLKERVIFVGRNRYQKSEVLKGITFNIKKGEAVGLIGKNGCGKSTTLKLLTRILKPNSGELKINGRVSSLIELGAGFHPDMTGRENIYINASIYGIKKKEIDRRLQDIIRFSELENFIDHPVRTYSSGMYMRLAFSIAINVDADILLIDEILAVGDAAFQTKCFNKLREIKRNGTTIVIVSHSLDQIEQICDRVIWLENGIIHLEGESKEVCKKYSQEMERKRIARLQKERMETQSGKQDCQNDAGNMLNKDSCYNLIVDCSPDVARSGTGIVHFTKVRLMDNYNKDKRVFEYGKPLKLQLDYISSEKDIEVNFSVGISRKDWIHCYENTYEWCNNQFGKISGKGTVNFIIESLNLAEGEFFIDIRIKDKTGNFYDNVFNLVHFQVDTPVSMGKGILSMPARWEID